MVYLKRFELLDDYQEHCICINESIRKLDNSTYPTHIFPDLELSQIDFSDITIIYGGNGSGKSTLLNIIASKLKALRKSSINKGLYFDEYVSCCKYEMAYTEPLEIKAITSDDIFDYLLDVRAINSGVNRRKDFLCREYIENRYSWNEDDIHEYEVIKDRVDSRHKSQKEYARDRLVNKNITEHSNGEEALLFWEREIKENSIYILDEPENSLSAENQMKLAKFIEDSARFYNCQFIISTHSPFILSLESKIYDLDTVPVRTRKWTELANVKIFYDFFKEHDGEFKD